MWAVVLAVGLSSAWRNPTAFALVFAWLTAEAVSLATGDSLPLATSFKVDVAVIAVILAKAIVSEGCRSYPSLRAQLKCGWQALTACDRLIIGLYLFGAWPIYVSTLHPYYVWWSLWAITIVQFLLAGTEALLRSVSVGKTKRGSSFFPRRDRFDEISVAAEVNGFSFDSYAGFPALNSRIPPDASYAGCISRVHALVPHVDRLAAIPQIFDAVIRLVAVYVVNPLVRPIAVVNRPRNAVGHKHSPASMHFDISLYGMAGFFACSASIPSRDARSNKPKQFTSFRLVAEKLTQLIGGGYLSVSHGAVPSRSGQGGTVPQHTVPARMYPTKSKTLKQRRLPKAADIGAEPTPSHSSVTQLHTVRYRGDG